jgi:hypothetical protein
LLRSGASGSLAADPAMRSTFCTGNNMATTDVDLYRSLLPMPEIATDTLIIAIQAVDAQVRQLRKAVERDDAEVEEMQLLESWEDAARDLEKAYDVEARDVLNLPPYDELLGG